MKRIMLIVLLAVVFFLIGYSQKLQTMEKKVKIEAADEITISTGKASIQMKKDGSIILSGKNISISGSGSISVKGTEDVIIKGKKVREN